MESRQIITALNQSHYYAAKIKIFAAFRKFNENFDFYYKKNTHPLIKMIGESVKNLTRKLDNEDFINSLTGFYKDILVIFINCPHPSEESYAISACLNFIYNNLNDLKKLGFLCSEDDLKPLEEKLNNRNNAIAQFVQHVSQSGKFKPGAVDSNSTLIFTIYPDKLPNCEFQQESIRGVKIFLNLKQEYLKQKYTTPKPLLNEADDEDEDDSANYAAWVQVKTNKGKHLFAGPVVSSDYDFLAEINRLFPDHTESTFKEYTTISKSIIDWSDLEKCINSFENKTYEQIYSPIYHAILTFYRNYIQELNLNYPDVKNIILLEPGCGQNPIIVEATSIAKNMGFNVIKAIGIDKEQKSVDLCRKQTQGDNVFYFEKGDVNHLAREFMRIANEKNISLEKNQTTKIIMLGSGIFTRFVMEGTKQASIALQQALLADKIILGGLRLVLATRRMLKEIGYTNIFQADLLNIIMAETADNHSLSLRHKNKFMQNSTYLNLKCCADPLTVLQGMKNAGCDLHLVREIDFSYSIFNVDPDDQNFNENLQGKLALLREICPNLQKIEYENPVVMDGSECISSQYQHFYDAIDAALEAFCTKEGITYPNSKVNEGEYLCLNFKYELPFFSNNMRKRIAIYNAKCMSEMSDSENMTSNFNIKDTGESFQMPNV